MARFQDKLLSPIAAILALLLVVASPWVFGGVLLREHAWLSTVATGACLCALFAGPGRGSSRVLICVLLFVLLSASQILRDRSVEWPTSELYLAKILVPIAAFWLGGRLFHSASMQRTLLWAIIAIAVAMTLFGIAQRLTWSGEMYWSVPIPIGDPFGSFVNRNNAGAFLCIGLGCSVAIALQRFLDDDLDQEAIVAGAASCLIFAGILATSSRGAVLAAVVGLLVLAIRFVRSRKGFIIGAAGLGLVGVISVSVAGFLGQSARTFERFRDLALTETTNGRLDHWADVAAGIAERPWTGWGVGTYEVAHTPFLSSDNGKTFEHADNLWFEVTYETGLVGITVIAICVACCFFAFWHRTADAERVSAAAIAGLVVTAMLAVQSLFDYAMLLPGVSVPAAIVVGAAFHRRSFQPAISRQVISVAFGCALLAGLVWGQSTLFAAAPIEMVAVKLPERWVPELLPLKKTESSIRELEDALANRPHDILGLLTASRLHIHRFRLNSKAAVAAEYGVEPHWDETALINQYRQWIRRDNVDPTFVESLRSDPLVLNDLEPTYEYARKLGQLTPLRRGPAIWQTVLGFADDAPLRSLKPLKNNALSLASWAAGCVSVGAVAAAANDTPLARSYWSKALKLSEKFDRDVANASARFLTVAEIVSEVVPQEADILLRFAANGTADATDPLRLAAVDRGAMLAEQLDEDVKRLELLAKAAELRGDPDTAITLLGEAADRSPQTVAYWVDLVRMNLETGDVREAVRCLRILESISPEHVQISALKQRVGRAVDVQGLRISSDAEG